MMEFLLVFSPVLVFILGAAWIMRSALPSWLRRSFISDEALLVAFLAEHGQEDVLSIKMDMEDFTRGEHDWSLKSDRAVYRILNRLEAEGVVKRVHGIVNYEYRLMAPPDKLLRIE